MSRAHDFHFLMRDLTLEVDAGRLTDLEAAAKVAEYMQKTLRCNTVSFWTVSGEIGQRVMRRAIGYDGVRNVVVSTAAEFPESGGEYFSALVNTGCYVCGNTFDDKNLAGVRDLVLVPYNIRALMSASYGRNGEVWGIITCTDNVERKWLPSEVTALRKAAAEISVRRGRRRDRAAGETGSGFL